MSVCFSTINPTNSISAAFNVFFETVFCMCLNWSSARLKETGGHLNEIDPRNGYCVTNDVTIGRRSFGIFRDDKMSDSIEMHVF